MRLISVTVSNQFAALYDLLRTSRDISNPDAMHAFWTAQAHDMSGAMNALRTQTQVSGRQIALHSYTTKAMRDSALAEAMRLGLLAKSGDEWIRGPRYDEFAILG